LSKLLALGSRVSSNVKGRHRIGVVPRRQGLDTRGALMASDREKTSRDHAHPRDITHAEGFARRSSPSTISHRRARGARRVDTLRAAGGRPTTARQWRTSRLSGERRPRPPAPEGRIRRDDDGADEQPGPRPQAGMSEVPPAGAYRAAAMESDST
jgi:hypothetical protein